MNDKQIDDAGREIERKNADAGLDVEAVLRLFLTGDGFIAECDIPHIVAALTAQPAVGEEIMVNTAHDVFILPLQPSGLDGSGPRFVVHVPAPEPQAAEVEALRAEVAEWKRVAVAQAELHGEAEAENSWQSMIWMFGLRSLK